jgi:hypothetical protein
MTSSTTDNTISDSVISGSATTDVRIRSNSVNNSFLNMSYSGVTVEAGSSLLREWYFDIYINDGTNPVEDATVSITNYGPAYDVTTDAGGYAPRQGIVEYVNNGGTIENKNTSLLVSKTGYTSDTWGPQMTTENKIAGQGGEIVLSLTSIDNTQPVISNPNPVSGYNYPADSPLSSWNVTTDEDATCKYSLNSDSTYGSMAGTFNTNGSTLHDETVGWANGSTYAYYIRCNDTSGNVNDESYYVRYTVANGTSAPPAEPQNVVPTKSGYVVTIDWILNLTMDHYEIEIDDDGDFSSPILSITDYNVGNPPVQETMPGAGTYYFRIRAVTGDSVAGTWSSQSISVTAAAIGSGAPGFELSLLLLLIAVLSASMLSGYLASKRL